MTAATHTVPELRRSRGERPFLVAKLKAGVGVDDLRRFVETTGGLS